jgi:thiamine-phosphate pyrophosphorylase
MTSARPGLVAISDRRSAPARATLERFLALGHGARPRSVVFQLRDLELPARERLAFGRELRAVARETGQLFVVNDRLDLALLLEADGVHLGEAGVETREARRLLGEAAFISRACHEPRSAMRLEADAVLLSPILEARKGRAALGLPALGVARRARAESDRPLLFALGGVDARGARACLEAGADGVAAIGAVLGEKGADELLRALGIAR